MPYPLIVVTGDSIAQLSFQAGGYGAALIDQYQGKCDVLNRGMGGYNSMQLLLRLEQGLDLPPNSDVSLFIIHIGTNDCAVYGMQAMPIPVYQENLRKIVAHIRQRYPCTKIILLTTSSVDTPTISKLDASFGLPEEFRTFRTADSSAKYAEALVEVATESKLPYVDVLKLHREMMENGKGFGDIFSDGLHYSPLGYSVVNRAISEIISRDLPHLMPLAFPDAFPTFASYGREGDDKSKRFAAVCAKLRARREGKPEPIADA